MTVGVALLYYLPDECAEDGLPHTRVGDAGGGGHCEAVWAAPGKAVLHAAKVP